MGPKGYAGTILKINLSSKNISTIPTQNYSDNFLGGRGFAAKFYWDEVPPEIHAFHPENRLMFFTGPLAGFKGIGSPRWTVCGKSPLHTHESFSYSNLGGSWGVRLKFAGYDGLVISGISERLVYISINESNVEIKEASSLWGKTTIETRERLKKELGKTTSIVSCGPAGENKVVFASLLADNDASGSGGFGAVMGSKNLKAIAVSGKNKIPAANPEKLKELSRHILELKKEEIGVRNQDFMDSSKMKRDICLGCIGPCIRQTYQAENGTKGKFMCGSAMFYLERARRYYGEINDVPFLANNLCDAYGVDAKSILILTMWLSRCIQSGILTDENTGIPLSKLGSLECIETLIKKISLREGFGDVLANGLEKAAESVGQGTDKFMTDYTSYATQTSAYCPRMYIVSAIFYAMEPRLPIQQLHEIGYTLFPWLEWVQKKEGAYLSSDLYRKIAKRFWGSELAVDFSTYEGKALAAAKIQDREYAKESLILCDFMWPIFHVTHTNDHMGDPTLENQLLSAITGKEISETDLYKIAERVLNLQRAILTREGLAGRKNDNLPEIFFTRPLRYATENPECLAPGKDGEVISRRGEVVDRQKFENLKTEYYQLRGWDPESGLQTKVKLEELALSDVADDLERRKLLR